MKELKEIKRWMHQPSQRVPLYMFFSRGFLVCNWEYFLFRHRNGEDMHDKMKTSKLNEELVLPFGEFHNCHEQRRNFCCVICPCSTCHTVPKAVLSLSRVCVHCDKSHVKMFKQLFISNSNDATDATSRLTSNDVLCDAVNHACFCCSCVFH